MQLCDTSLSKQQKRAGESRADYLDSAARQMAAECWAHRAAWCPRSQFPLLCSHSTPAPLPSLDICIGDSLGPARAQPAALPSHAYPCLHVSAGPGAAQRWALPDVFQGHVCGCSWAWTLPMPCSQQHVMDVPTRQGGGNPQSLAFCCHWCLGCSLCLTLPPHPSAPVTDAPDLSQHRCVWAGA